MIFFLSSEVRTLMFVPLSSSSPLTPLCLVCFSFLVVLLFVVVVFLFVFVLFCFVFYRILFVFVVMLVELAVVVAVFASKCLNSSLSRCTVCLSSP